LIALKFNQKVLIFRKNYTPKFLGCYTDRPSWAVEPAWVAAPPRRVFGLGFVAQPSNPVVFW
jgi:hypothetical protein